jgi:SAM-dependent methyltransferase
MSPPGRGEPTAYHLQELRIARSPDDPRRIMPPIPPGCRRIIDIGCGIGQTLIASELPGALACGVEPDIGALRFGRTVSHLVQPVCGEAETLPIRTGWAEFALARLSLPYTHIPKAVGEVYRVLAPGGQFWSVLHPMGMTLRDMLGSALRLRGRALLYQSYVLLNGLTLHTTGRQIRYPLSRRRCESFQTEGGMRRVLRAAGFEAITIKRRPFFIASARKPGAAG